MSLNIRKTSTNPDRTTARKPAAAESMMQQTTLTTTAEPILAPLAERSHLRAKTEDASIGTAPSSISAPGIAQRNTTALAPESQKNKTELVISLLSTQIGATVEDIMNATNWQKHSVRGFLSGTVRKKFGLNLISEVAGDGARRYRIKDRDGVNKVDAGTDPASVSTQISDHATAISQAE
jgi:hypothetical protein